MMISRISHWFSEKIKDLILGKRRYTNGVLTHPTELAPKAIYLYIMNEKPDKNGFYTIYATDTTATIKLKEYDDLVGVHVPAYALVVNNTGIGLFSDREEGIQRAIKYAAEKFPRTVV